MVVSAFTRLWNHQYALIPEHFHHFQTLYSLAVTLHCPSCQLLENINSLSASRDLSILDISYKWNRTVYNLLDQLCSFGLTSSRFICVLAYINISFLFIYSVDISITFCLSINQLIGNWVASIFWLSWIMLLWTFINKFLHGYMLTPWKESYEQPRQHIKKKRHYFVNKDPSNQGYGLPSSHIWMWELDYKESWAPKNWCFWTVVL